MSSQSARWMAIVMIATFARVARAAEVEAPVEFAEKIQPLFAEKCLECHGADADEGGLRLHLRAAALAELDSGDRAIVPGKPLESQLLRRIKAVDDSRMPPEGAALTQQQIELLTRWIGQGAQWQTHWAFRPLQPTVAEPRLMADRWARNAIDAFVLEGLKSSGQRPADAAPRAVLMKRLYYDLLGLPPTPDAVQRFVKDPSPAAYEVLVDRLLASPAFAERWGRHWLDKARYADSDGYEKDRPRPNAWRYRDWVLAAFNNDMPFDQFTTEQIAGDLLPEATADQILATAFHRQTLTNTEGGTDPEQWRVAAVMDRTETLGTVWLGLTVGCARCHSHKYDRLSQTEYYQLYAFFNNADEVNCEVDESPTGDRRLAVARKRHARELQVLEARIAALETRLGSSPAEWESKVSPEEVADEIGQILAIAPPDRNEDQRAKLTGAYQVARKLIADLRNELKERRDKSPSRKKLQVRVVGQRTQDARTTHLLTRGDFKRPQQPVEPDSLAVLPPVPSRGDARDRLDLARWLVQRDNPLVARVAVNHLWQHLFGEGLVTTPADFGVRGEPPAYPRLLDHLALEYGRVAWSRKALIRHIVLSATYRQSSAHRPEFSALDPQNRLIHRQNRFRVEAETLRDLTLAVSGLLSRRFGGPSVYPPMPPEAAAVSYANNFQWSTSPGENRYRRGIYTFFKRTAPHPTLVTFDCPDANVTNVRRNRSNTPLGALTLLNNPVYFQAASALAGRVIAQESGDRERMQLALQLCVARQPLAAEIDILLQLLNDSRDYYRAHLQDAAKVANGARVTDESEMAAWTATMRSVLNLDEFITRE